MDKVHHNCGRNLHLLVDGGGSLMYSRCHKHERRANVIRTVANLGKRFRAEPCLKHDGGQKGSPQTPLPKVSLTGKSFRCTFLFQYTPGGVVLKRVSDDVGKRNFLPL